MRFQFGLAICLGLGLWAMAPCFGAEPLQSDTSQKQPGEEVKDQSGNTFMEEVPKAPEQETPKPKLLPDLTRIDVPVDPNGKIVPLKNTETGPVLPFYSKMEQSFEPLYQPVPFWGYPYGGIPGYGFNPYGFPGYVNRAPISFGFQGGSFRMGMGMPVTPYVNPYGFGPTSPWFVPPMMMPTNPAPVPFVYSPAYPQF